MTTRNQLLVALVATFALTATRVRAQVVLGPAVTPAECTAAAAALSSGQNRNGRGWERLAACGVTGEGPIATAIATAVSETDSVYLDYLWLAGTNLRSRQIFNVSRTVANNASATVSARVTAISILLAQYDPSVRVPILPVVDEPHHSAYGFVVHRIQYRPSRDGVRLSRVRTYTG